MRKTRFGSQGVIVVWKQKKFKKTLINERSSSMLWSGWDWDGWMDGMVIIGHRSSKSTFGSNNPKSFSKPGLPTLQLSLNYGWRFCKKCSSFSDAPTPQEVHWSRKELEVVHAFWKDETSIFCIWYLRWSDNLQIVRAAPQERDGDGPVLLLSPLNR